MRQRKDGLSTCANAEWRKIPTQVLRLPALNTSANAAAAELFQRIEGQEPQYLQGHGCRDVVASSIEGCDPQYLRLGLSLRRCAKY